MTLRDNLTQAKQAAHQVLDRVAQNLPVPDSEIKSALIVLGDVE